MFALTSTSENENQISTCLEDVQTAQDSQHDHHDVNGDGEAAVTGCVAITHAASCLALCYTRGFLLLVSPFFTKFHKIVTKFFCAASSLFFLRVLCCGAVQLIAGEVGGAINLGLIFLTLVRGVVFIDFIDATLVALKGIGCKIKIKQVFICAN